MVQKAYGPQNQVRFTREEATRESVRSQTLLKAVVSGVNRMLKKKTKAGGPIRAREVRVPAEPVPAGSFAAQALKQQRGLDLPPRLEAEFSRFIQTAGIEAAPERICKAFEAEYLAGGRYGFVEHSVKTDIAGDGRQTVTATVTAAGEPRVIHGRGSGPLAGFIAAMASECGLDFDLAGYREHIIGTGANAGVAAYVELSFADGRSGAMAGRFFFARGWNLVAALSHRRPRKG